jgi:hypothetical protein
MRSGVRYGAHFFYLIIQVFNEVTDYKKVLVLLNMNYKFV